MITLIILFIILMMLGYFIGSASQADFNITEWNQDDRKLIFIVCSIFSLISSAIFVSHNEDKRNGVR